MLGRLGKGEKYVVVAGGFLLLSLLSFPWHRVAVSGFLIRRTGLQSPNALQGTLAFLVAAAMVAQVVMTRYTNQKVNPTLARLQPPAGLAVVGLLAWKLAAETSYLSVGAYLGILLAGAMAYGAFTMAGESGRDTSSRKGLRKAKPVTATEHVIVIPAGTGGLDATYLANLNDCIVRTDGSFTAGRSMALESQREGISFQTPADAIRWAEARGWTVINKSQF